jgi:putative Mn2+ efflux pump MntP
VKLYQGLRQGSEDCPERGATLKTLKPIEAVVLATGLSLDGLAAGFGAALGGTNAIAMLIVSLVAHMVAVPLGCMLGMRLSKKTTLNISWIGGGVIIILAFTKLLY